MDAQAGRAQDGRQDESVKSACSTVHANVARVCPALASDSSEEKVGEKNVKTIKRY